MCKEEREADYQRRFPNGWGVFHEKEVKLFETEAKPHAESLRPEGTRAYEHVAQV